MADEILQFDGHSLSDLAHDLRAAAARFRRETDTTLAKVGMELMGAARAIANEHSHTVASTIKMRTAPGLVIITVGDENTPIAALWELGNKGTHDTGKVQGVTFRHPVFGRWDVSAGPSGHDPRVQRRFPMLRPAEQALRKQITRAMNDAYNRTLEPYRLRPTEGL